MRLELEIPDELQTRLAAEAVEAGTRLENYVLKLLMQTSFPKKPQSGAELVEFWEEEGLIGTRPDIPDSQKHARLLREKAQQRDLS